MFSDNPLNWQEGGDHYARLEYQPVQFIQDLNLDFPRANAIKYLARLGHKIGADPKQDIDKAVHYLKIYDKYRKERREKVMRFLGQFDSQFIQQAIYMICEIPGIGLAETNLELIRYRLEKDLPICREEENKADAADEDEDEEESEVRECPS